jgi:hypothetical protein
MHNTLTAAIFSDEGTTGSHVHGMTGEAEEGLLGFMRSSQHV